MSAPAVVDSAIVPGSDDEVPRLAAEFENGTLPQAAWTHRAHLLVALWYSSHLEPEEALAAMRYGILRLNGVHGVETTPTRGYHETITRAYMRLVRGFVASEGSREPWARRAAKLMERHGERDHLLRYYSRERLMSQEARFGWVEPDVGRLPGVAPSPRSV